MQRVTTAEEVVNIASSIEPWIRKGGRETVCEEKFGVGMWKETWINPRTEEPMEFFFVSKRDGLSILPILPNGDILLTIASKARVGVVIGFPAALRHLELLDDAAREMTEETGYGASLIIMNAAKIIYAGLKIEGGYDVLAATNLTGEGKQDLDAGESDIILVQAPLAVVTELVVRGTITNTEVYSALLLAHLTGHITLPQHITP